MIEASCHCGAVKIEVEEAPTELTSCNCSICRRLGTLWAYYRASQVRIAGDTATYRWGDERIDFHRCARCGCITHWSSVDPTSDRMGINTRLMDSAIVVDIRVRRLDGADTWRFLDEE